MTSNKSVLQQNTSGVPRFAPLLIALLAVILVSVLLMVKLAPARTASVTSPDFVQATQVFTPGQPMTITAENIVIYIPRDSLNLPGTISVISQDPSLFSTAAQPEWTRPQVIEVLFLNTQATPVPNIVFSNPVHVCFRITPEQWEDFTQRPDAYQVQYYAVENNPQTWQSLPMTTYADMTMLCGETVHFSVFALAVRVDSSIPVTSLTATATPVVSGAQRTPDDSEEATDPTAQPPQPTDVTAPNDPPPTAPPPAGQIHKQCRDGIDNDSDGLTDTDDPGCRNAGDDDEN